MGGVPTRLAAPFEGVGRVMGDIQGNSGFRALGFGFEV